MSSRKEWVIGDNSAYEVRAAAAVAAVEGRPRRGGGGTKTETEGMGLDGNDAEHGQDESLPRALVTREP